MHTITQSNPGILIVDDEDNLRNLLVKWVRKEGFQPIEASNGKEAIELYKLTNPAVVISDVMMPEIDGITLLEEIKRIDPQAVIILMTGFGNETILLKALRGGATNFFRKPFNFQEVLDVIKNVIKHRQNILPGSFFSPFLKEEKKYFDMETEKTFIFPIINQISLHFQNIFPKSDIINLKIGMEEMISNAIEHGNLGISFTEKNKAIEDGRFGELLESRLNTNNNRFKKIFISSELTTEYFKITVRDEGDGFDWQSLFNSFPSSFLTFNGRGVFLTRIFYDEVIYNDKGNEVTIIKRKHV